MRTRSRLSAMAIATVGGALLLSACSSSTSSDSSPATNAVATTTILGDIVGSIAQCGGGTSTTLLPNGADPHDFAPSSQQLAMLSEASLVVANGLGLEAGLADALASAKTDGATVLEVGTIVDPIAFQGAAHSDEEAHSEDEAHSEEGAFDPHVWFDMSRMATAAEQIGATLAERTGDDAYVQCGKDEAAAIRAGDERVRDILSSIPAERRVLVTDHDALGYFAEAYDFRIIGAVVPSGTTLAEPSSAELAALAQLIQENDVPAIFTNESAPSALAAAVAEEAGRDVAVVPLHIESIGEPGTASDTYVGMMEENATSIAKALAS